MIKRFLLGLSVRANTGDFHFQRATGIHCWQRFTKPSLIFMCKNQLDHSKGKNAGLRSLSFCMNPTIILLKKRKRCWKEAKTPGQDVVPKRHRWTETHRCYISTSSALLTTFSQRKEERSQRTFPNSRHWSGTPVDKPKWGHKHMWSRSAGACWPRR